MALGAALLAALALVDVTITGPRVTVRWRPDISAPDRAALERRYDLRSGAPEEGATWRYELGDRSRENIGALAADPAVDDTGYIDRNRLTAPDSEVRVAIRPPFPFSTDNRFENRWQLFQVQSLWLLLGGGVMLSAARAPAVRRRRAVAVGTLLLVGAMGWAFPIDPSLVRMGDANQSIQSRVDFENYAGVTAVRSEAHLSYAVLGRLDRLFGQNDESPARAQTAFARGATAWFVLFALAIGFVEGWSPLILRYLALVLLAPAALLYFGWREIGYVSLNVAAFPLLARGLRDGSWRLEGGSALIGLGAALHGFALVAFVGALVAALATRARFVDRIGRLLRVAAWGSAAYTGWFAVYVIVLKLPITVGHAEYFPWRPWFADQILEGRVNAAIFSATGARDLSMTMWVVGAPLLVVAASLWRRYGNEVRTAMGYALSSVIFTILLWPVQGLGEEMDLVFTRFPAIYALAWVCAHDSKRTNVAAALLISAHLAFWRIVLDSRFINSGA
jgi:hypothetical protein